MYEGTLARSVKSMCSGERWPDVKPEFMPERPSSTLPRRESGLLGDWREAMSK